MFCKSCGQNVSDISAFCKNCGEGLDETIKPEVSFESPAFCTSCGAKSQRSSYCKDCGNALTIYKSSASASARAVAAPVEHAAIPPSSPAQVSHSQSQQNGVPAITKKIKEVSKQPAQNLGINVNSGVKSPLIFAVVFGAIGMLLSLIIYVVLDGSMDSVIESMDESEIVKQLVFAVTGFGGSAFSIFLRSVGNGFSTIFRIEVMSEIVEESVSTSFGIAILLLVPFLSVFIARRLKKNTDEQNVLVGAVFNSLWIGLLSIILSFLAGKFKLSFDVPYIDTAQIIQSFSMYSAFGCSFAVSLLVQFIYDYRARRESFRGRDIGDGGAIGDGIQYGLGPVKQAAVGMAALTLVLIIVTLMSEDVSNVLNENSLNAFVVLLVFLPDIVFKLTCLLFGIPFVMSFSAPDINNASFSCDISVFGITLGKYKESLPLISVAAILFVSALFIIQFHSINKKHEGKSYWLSGGVSLAIHCTLMMLMSRFTSFSFAYKPSKDMIREIGNLSSKTNELFIGMRGGLLFLILLPAIVYLLIGFLDKKDSVISRLGDTLCNLRVVVVILGVVLFAACVYASSEDLAKVFERMVEDMEDMVSVITNVIEFII